MCAVSAEAGPHTDSAISLFGLGKLGACMSACMAAAGFRVYGVDINEATVRAVDEKVAPVAEAWSGRPDY